MRYFSQHRGLENTIPNTGVSITHLKNQSFINENAAILQFKEREAACVGMWGNSPVSPQLISDMVAGTQNSLLDGEWVVGMLTGEGLEVAWHLYEEIPSRTDLQTQDLAGHCSRCCHILHHCKGPLGPVTGRGERGWGGGCSEKDFELGNDWVKS